MASEKDSDYKDVVTDELENETDSSSIDDSSVVPEDRNAELQKTEINQHTKSDSSEMASKNNSDNKNVVTDEPENEKDSSSIDDSSVVPEDRNAEKSDVKYQQIDAEQYIVEELPDTPKYVSTSQQEIKTRNNEHDLSADLIKQQTKPGGLYNSASTCYMNAMIQALSSSDVLINTLKNLKTSHSNSSVSLLYDLLNALNEGNIKNKTVMRNTKLLENLIESVGWTKPSQQDAFDLLSALICDIYKRSNDELQNNEGNLHAKRKSSKMASKNNSNNNSFVTKKPEKEKGKNSNSADEFRVGHNNNIKEIEIPLGIKLLHEFQGIDFPNTIQEYIGLSLNLCGNYEDPPGAPLVFLINQHFVSKAIDEDQFKLTRLSLFREIPNILLIHIQANKWDPINCQMIKPSYYIQYDENMTINFDIAHEINGKNQNLNEDRILGTEVEYRLKSIVYQGGNISGGHYVACRKWREEWYLADDKLIKRMPLNTKIPPYIMIYERSILKN